MRQRLKELLIDVDAVELDIGLASAAGELADRHSLTASDAIHLASALSLPNEQAVIVSWDERLRQASREAGLAVAPAEV